MQFKFEEAGLQVRTASKQITTRSSITLLTFLVSRHSLSYSSNQSTSCFIGLPFSLTLPTYKNNDETVYCCFCSRFTFMRFWSCIQQRGIIAIIHRTTKRRTISRIAWSEHDASLCTSFQLGLQGHQENWYGATSKEQEWWNVSSFNGWLADAAFEGRKHASTSQGWFQGRCRLAYASRQG